VLTALKVVIIWLYATAIMGLVIYLFGRKGTKLMDWIVVVTIVLLALAAVVVSR